MCANRFQLGSGAEDETMSLILDGMSEEEFMAWLAGLDTSEEDA
jgi:hypothetical protein